MVKSTYTIKLAGHDLTIENGEVAKQADGAVLVRFGDTTVLSTVVSKPAAIDADFFPLTINYEEKKYAAGKIPGGFIKREGKPSDGATLIARMIDRPLRPLFPEGFKDEVQVTNLVLSAEPDCSPALAAMIGSSLCLGISDIPFGGPVAAVEVGRVADHFVIAPTKEQQGASDLDITVAGTAASINMVEAGCDQVEESDVLDALEFGEQEIKKLCAFQQQIITEIGQTKRSFVVEKPDKQLESELADQATDALKEAILTNDKQERDQNIAAVKNMILEHYDVAGEDELLKNGADLAEVSDILDDLEKKIVRKLITVDRVRPDHRACDEIRPLTAQIDYIPRVHGSGLFTRGQTQVLSTLTLAPMSEGQTIDDLGEEKIKNFIHQYNFPQFSVGETGRMRAPGRREIGHGALGERALKPVIPATADFPYTIRLVADVLESNGSSSQASICAGTLALMAAGVPIKAPVAGIAMGLIKDEQDYTILTDIQGIEDHLGDMDFKVAGTKQGITALQMDIKVDGVNRNILSQALQQAKKARLEILDVIETTIPAPRKHLSLYAPKVETMQIDQDQIKVVIGKGGETINKIIDETGVKIDIDEDGTVRIMSSEQNKIDRTEDIIRILTKKVKVGEIYEATVIRIEKFGAIVELFHNKQALVHISQLAKQHVDKVSDIVSVGEKMEVKITEVDMHDRIKASHRAIIENKAVASDSSQPSSRRDVRNKNKQSFQHTQHKKAPQFVIKQKDK